MSNRIKAEQRRLQIKEILREDDFGPGPSHLPGSARRLLIEELEELEMTLYDPNDEREEEE